MDLSQLSKINHEVSVQLIGELIVVHFTNVDTGVGLIAPFTLQGAEMFLQQFVPQVEKLRQEGNVRRSIILGNGGRNG